MAQSKSGIRMGNLLLANILIPIAVLVFATGFFPYKPFLSGLATFEEVENEEHGLGLLSKDTRPEKVFDKVVFMVVDALRSDFVYGHGSGFVFTQSLIRTGAAVPLTAHAAPPTVTMPRVKGLTSGSVPSFLDLILNFAESDTSSSLALQDTWLAQIKQNSQSADGKIVFYGDDTWLKLFPDFFARADGTTSFFVSDFTEVDNNVTRHVPEELRNSDWNAMIMHYLGLDHIGHKSGPLSSNMLPKQQEMDGVVETIYEAMNTLPHLENTLLVLAGDHGMNSAGNHGGSAAGETSPALVFISPKLREITCDADLSKQSPSKEDVKSPASAVTIFAMEQKQKLSKVNAGAAQGDLAAYLTQIWDDMGPADKAVYESLSFRDKMRYEEDYQKAYCRQPVSYKAPVDPKEGTEFDFYHRIEQSDLVPTMAALLGVPVSRNNLGIIIPEMLGFWSRDKRANKGRLRPNHQLLYRNSLQILRILKAAYSDELFEMGHDKSTVVDLESEIETCKKSTEGGEQLSCKWRLVQHVLFRDAGEEGDMLVTSILTDFLTTAQDTLSASASSYNVARLVAGVAIATLATALAVHSNKTLWPLTTISMSFGTITTLLGVMMFATSYVEEEQLFWYWVIGAWIVVLYFTRPSQLLPASLSPNNARNAALAAFLLLAAHRLTTRWNQTGQKHAGASDIAHTFFPAHHMFLWVLVIGTYSHLAVRFALRTFSNLAAKELAAMTALSLVLPSLLFKLNFTQADSPELVQGLAADFRRLTAEWNLVTQARASFVGIAVAAVAVTVLMWLRKKWIGQSDEAGVVSLPQRLHDLLTLFLMTQTRVQNVPLFLLFEIQLQMLYILLAPTHAIPAPTPIDSNSETTEPPSSGLTTPSWPARPSPRPPIPPVLASTISVLVFTHASFFALGGSNAISSLDLSNAYNGVSGYNVVAVGLLLFASNWAGPIWWSMAAVLLIQRLRDGPGDAVVGDEGVEEEKKKKKERKWVEEERSMLSARVAASESEVKVARKGRESVLGRSLWWEHISALTVFVCAGLVAVMLACTVLRTHLFIWTVFSPKYLYAMAWSLAWHFGVNIGLGGLLYRLGRK